MRVYGLAASNALLEMAAHQAAVAITTRILTAAESSREPYNDRVSELEALVEAYIDGWVSASKTCLIDDVRAGLSHLNDLFTSPKGKGN